MSAAVRWAIIRFIRVNLRRRLILRNTSAIIPLPSNANAKIVPSNAISTRASCSSLAGTTSAGYDVTVTTLTLMTLDIVSVSRLCRRWRLRRNHPTNAGHWKNANYYNSPATLSVRFKRKCRLPFCYVLDVRWCSISTSVQFCSLN